MSGCGKVETKARLKEELAKSNLLLKFWLTLASKAEIEMIPKTLEGSSPEKQKQVACQAPPESRIDSPITQALLSKQPGLLTQRSAGTTDSYRTGENKERKPLAFRGESVPASVLVNYVIVFNEAFSV